MTTTTQDQAASEVEKLVHVLAFSKSGKLATFAPVRVQSMDDAWTKFLQLVADDDPSVIRYTEDGTPMIRGDFLFRLKETHGFPLDFSVDIVLERGFAIEWVGLIEAARKAYWWDYQTYEQLQMLRREMPERRHYFDEVIFRFQHYVVAHPHPLLEQSK